MPPSQLAVTTDLALLGGGGGTAGPWTLSLVAADIPAFDEQVAVTSVADGQVMPGMHWAAAAPTALFSASFKRLGNLSGGHKPAPGASATKRSRPQRGSIVDREF